MNDAITGLFGLTVFWGAVLLFSAEPMIGKLVLPRFGGAPAVWNTCLVHFQLLLLLGYTLSGGPRASSERAEIEIEMKAGAARFRPSARFLGFLAVLTALAWWMLPLGPSSAVPEARAAFSSGNDLARSAGPPTVALMKQLWATTALPLLIVSATAPLAQRWFAQTGHPRASDPYFLYAASNAGSLLALLAYPFLIEPALSLAAQRRAWSLGFLAFAGLMTACALITRALSTRRDAGAALFVEQPAHHSSAENRSASASVLVSASLAARWLILALVPSSWLLGVTTALTTDLAPVPLLWVVPLALYLSSFIVAFAAPGGHLVRLSARALPVLALPLALVLAAGFVQAYWAPLHLLTFFVGCVACHGALARARPPARGLSAFYLAMALGGALGGAFNTWLAPLLFHRVAEYPLAVVLGCLLANRPDEWNRNWKTAPRDRTQWLGELAAPVLVFLFAALVTTNQAGLANSTLGAFCVTIASGLAVLAWTTARRRPLRFALVLAAVLAAGGLAEGPSGRPLLVERNFFGVVRVTEDAVRQVRRLFHGSTLHGEQSLEPEHAREPSTYFTRSGPVGQLFEAIGPRLDRPGTRVAVIGLGVGTLAAYARPSQEWTFYEIDPAIERIAQSPRYFTYLKNSAAGSLRIVDGDARLRLAEAPEHAYRLIVLDAFSSDALPVHLLTREAIALYRSKLAPGGVLAFNLSTRYVELGPLIARQSLDAGLACRLNADLALSRAEREGGKQPSIWAVMAASDDDLGPIADDARWRAPAPRPGARAWTDDYSDLVRYLRFLPRRLTVWED